MLRRKANLLILLGAVLLSLTTASAADLETGLWHLLDNRRGNTVCFMVNGGADAWKVYSGQWKAIKVPEFAENGTFRATLPFGKRPSVSVHIEGSFKGERLTGTWQIRHLQFQESGTWKAVRISSDPEWKPWAAILRNREKVVNLTERLAEGVPFSNFSDFKRAWREGIEEDYYAVLTSTLYAGPSGSFNKKFRDEQLNSIYKKASQESGGISTARSVEAAARAVHEDLKTLYSWYKLDASILALPTGGQFDFRYFGLPGPQRRFFLISTDWVGMLPEVQMKILLAQGLLYAALREGRSFPVTTVSDIALRGITAHLSRQLAYSTGPYDLLFIKEGDERRLAAGFNEFRKMLLKDGRIPIRRTFPRFLEGETRSESYYFGYQFAHRLLQTFTVKEILRIDIAEKFLPQLNDFIADESVTPVPLSEIGS